MAVDEKWYFTKEQLLQSPSRKSGYDVDKELSCRQQAANFIQDMGQRLQVSQLCINTAIVYMHRFYVFHSLAAFHRNAIAAAALFLAAKVEEQPRKLEHVIKVAHMCLHRENPNLDTKSELYLEQAQDLVFNENVLLQTLGFDVAIDHPHTHVVRCCQLVRASKDLAQTSYFMASNSLHLTTMCLQYKPTVVACFCIHLACKWSNWEIPRSNEGKDWFWYIDKTVTIDLLEQLTAEFLAILDKCPTKLKRKMMSMNQNNTPGFTQQSVSQHDGAQFEEPRKLTGSEVLKPPEGLFAVQKSNLQSSGDKPSASTSSAPSHPHHQKIDYREYREKKERERMEREKQQQQRENHTPTASNHHHHSKSNIMQNKGQPHTQSRSSSGSVSHKSYQQQPIHGMQQQNIHFQNVKDNRESNSQSSFQSSSSKDNNYLKQHPPHGDRESNKDGVPFHGQYSQNSNLQHQNYPHKSDSNYSANYAHRESSRGSHGVPSGSSSNLSQSHHSQNQMNTGSSMNLTNNPKEYLMGSSRDSTGIKDSESQSLTKDSMSSSIRDIINQSVSQKELHSMTNDRKEHMRDKSRMNYIHGSASTMSYRSESIKSGREVLNESTDRKMDEFALKLTKEKSLKKGEEDATMDAIKIEPSHMKLEKLDETDMRNENGTWTLPSVKNEKSNVPVSVKSDSNLGKNEVSVDPSKLESYFSNSDSNKSQSMHTTKSLYDSKYKTHHYHSSTKSSEVPLMKVEKPGVQCSSEIQKKIVDRGHEKHRKVQEGERISHALEGSGTLGDISKHHKFGKEMSEKNKVVMSGAQGDQRLKEKMSPSLYQKMKTMPSRPGSVGHAKTETGHHNTDNSSIINASAGDRNDMANQSMKLHRTLGTDEGVKQKPHEFGGIGSQSNQLQDSITVKSNKTSSIFSPDSKIPPHNILSSLEKDSSKKNSSSSHRGHSSNKTPPNLKKGGSGSVVTPISASATSTTGSLFSPPLPKNIPSIPPRHRTPSSGSEPELIPVLTKLEDTPGYENIMKERKIALNHSGNDALPNIEKEKKSGGLSSDKLDGGSAFVFGSDHKNSSKESKSVESKNDSFKSDGGSQSTSSKSAVNAKFPNEIRSDLGAVIYPTNPKSGSSSKSSQGFSSTDRKHTLSDSVSTVNLLGIEKMVDTSISPAKQGNQTNFQAATCHQNALNATTNAFGSTTPSSGDHSDKLMVDQVLSKTSSGVSGFQEPTVDVLGYSEKKKSEKKKKKEKHKHKEKDKDKSERKKEKKKHKAKDKERSKEKEKTKDKEKYKEKDRHREKEIDVVSSEIPIKITIPKDKISGSLKFKISKDCLKKEVESDSLKSNTSGELKIKISKDVISGIGGYKEESKSESKKRERSPKSSSDLPHSKSLKTSDKKSSSSASSLKSNGTEGSSRNTSSHRYSVSENGSCFDISSLYDLPFDFEENGLGIIKTPDYDFEALNDSENLNTSPEPKEFEECDRSSHSELDKKKRDEDENDNEGDQDDDDNDNDNDDENVVIMGKLVSSLVPSRPEENGNINDLTTDVTLKPISPINDRVESPRQTEAVSRKPMLKNEIVSAKASPLYRAQTEEKKDVILSEEPVKGQGISVDNCDVLKNYKTILDSHSRRCEPNVSNPVTAREKMARGSGRNNDDNNNKNTCGTIETVEKLSKQPSKSTNEMENPNYYNKYFKKDGGGRMRTRDDKRLSKGRIDDNRYDDKQRYYDSRRFRSEYNDRDRRDDRRFHREYSKESSQYYFERKEERRFEYPGPGYPPAQYFNAGKPPETTPNPTVYQSCLPPKPAPPQFPHMPTNPAEMNVRFQYGYFNNYMYPNGGYRFYGNVPYVNMSLIQQQPIPPGTGDSIDQVEPPPLPLEPPPDLPPPPETPPPPPK